MIWSSVMVELSIAVEWGNQRVQIYLVIVCLLINSSGLMGILERLLSAICATIQLLDDAEFCSFAEHVGDVLYVHLGVDALAVGVDGVD